MTFNINGKEWTGERLETFVYTESTIEHLHRYAMALELVKNKEILDIACGEGYGTRLLAGMAKHVTGVDIDQTTIELAKEKYSAPNIVFKTGSADKIPCKDNSFDIVVSFETIEHHDKHVEMMQEIKRVLRPDGILIISSPDKLYYSDIPKYSNPYHVKELYKDEFKALINQHFKNAHLFGQKWITGSIVTALDEESNGINLAYDGDYEQLTSSTFNMTYNIAIATDGELPKLSNSFFNGDAIHKAQITESINYTRHVTSIDTAAATKKVAAQATEDAISAATAAIKKTLTYRIGNMVLRPFSFFKKLFNA